MERTWPSIVYQAFEMSQRPSPRSEDLEEVLLSSIQSYDVVYLLLDALDECPEDDEVRKGVL